MKYQYLVLLIPLHDFIKCIWYVGRVKKYIYATNLLHSLMQNLYISKIIFCFVEMVVQTQVINFIFCDREVIQIYQNITLLDKPPHNFDLLFSVRSVPL